jgi:hydrogenase maturation protease
MQPTLIIGYGNLDREDDGVAWHILAEIARRLGRPVSEDGFFPAGENPDLWFALQLTPEMAETVAQYDRVVFVDAHTGAVAEELHFERLSAGFQASPFTHHLTPQTCLSFAKTLYGREPEAVLVSVRGYEFGFATTLSPRTTALAVLATDRIFEWISA